MSPSFKTRIFLLTALFPLFSEPVFATTATTVGCFEPPAQPVIYDMPFSFATFKGTTTVGVPKEKFNNPPEFVNNSFRFGDGVVHHLRELLGEGSTAAVFALNQMWAIRLNTQMDFLPPYILGHNFFRALKVPSIEIREIPTANGSRLDYLESEYVVIKRLYPKHFDTKLEKGEETTFKKASALNLYKNWDSLDPVAREAAHKELLEFIVTLAPLETYFDFQPTNLVRTTEGWKFIDPSLASLEIKFATPTSVAAPFAVPGQGSNNWFQSKAFNIQGEGRIRLGQLLRAIIDYRRSHPTELMEAVARGKAALGIQ